MNSNVPKYDFNNKLQTGHESALTDKGIPTYQYTLPPTHPVTKINMLNQTWLLLTHKSIQTMTIPDSNFFWLLYQQSICTISLYVQTNHQNISYELFTCLTLRGPSKGGDQLTPTISSLWFSTICGLWYFMNTGESL